ncbi:hypothetical protein [Actinomadura parmotrematis]|uniref:Sulfotransferase family protein n=1 Tax=Actinomadura parmotrematis TaxID=2864039 RepID=A0ABS7G4F5_9ACTN|nr:hypothetical protein [Actinomadura parmotrematis]MBW8487573.1 hypothetical protein [Actinomadura parmotrematis]
MAEKVILHIGQQKSGTTYLQEVLGHCAGELAGEAGIWFPPSLRDVLPDAIENHERATYGLLGTEYPWVTAAQAAGEQRKWTRLAARAAEWPGTVLVSAEALSVVRAGAVRDVVAAFAPAEPHVVITTRGLGRTLPSLWQQHVRNGRRQEIERYFEQLAGQRDLGPEVIERDREQHLWRAFAIGRLVRRWAAVVGPERVTVIVNPGSPPDRLWRLFAEAIGAPSFAGRPPEAVLERRTHSGLTLPEAQVLVRVNALLGKDGWTTYSARAVRERLLLNGMLARTERGPRVGVPAAARATVERWSREDVADLLATGARVLGDLDDLRFDAARDVHRPPSAGEVADAAAAAVMALADRADFPQPPAPTRRRFGARR